MEEKKKHTIIYIITKLELGGAQKVCLELFNAFDKTDEVRLISGKEGVLTPTVAEHTHTILLDSFKREVSLGMVITEIKNFIRLVRILKNIKRLHPDSIIHTHSTKAGIIGRWAAFFADIPYRIHTVHGFGFHPHQPKIAWFIHYLLELITSCITHRYICVSTADIQHGTKLLPRFQHKHTLIRAATLTSPLPHQLSPKRDDLFIFGTIACFKQQKNLFDLLKAFHLCYQQNQNVRLEIIGDGILKPQIKEWIHDHALAAVIQLHGWQKAVNQFLERWHAFTLTSLWEGLPCAIVEARLHQLPVITYKTGGITDIIKHEKNGLVCIPKDYKAFSMSMARLSKDPALYHALASYADNLEPYTINAMINAHKELYSSLHG